MRRSLLAAGVGRSVRAGVVAAVALLVPAGEAIAAPTWLAPFEPLPASTSFMTPAMNAGGEILFADRTDLGGGKKAFRVAARAPGGGVSAPTLFPPAGSTTLGFAPALALADDGHAIAAWADGGGAFYALRSPGGAWGAPTPVPGATHVTNVVAGIDATGTATLGWAENSNPSPDFMNPNDASVKLVRISPGAAVGGSQTVLFTITTTDAAAAGTLQVAGSGRAIFIYTLGQVTLFTDATVAFRDSATGTFGDATDLGTRFTPIFRGAVSDVGRSAFVESSGASIALRVREPGGTLGPAMSIDAGTGLSNALVGLAGDGAITLAWDLQAVADPRVLACTATATACVGEPQRLSAPASSLGLTSMAVNAAGGALVAWSTFQSTPTVVFRAKAALRPASNAVFGPEQDVAPPPARSAAVALDAAGDGVAVFTAGAPMGSPIKAAGLDAAGPRIDVTAPASVAQGRRAAFSASAADLWSQVTGLSWSFGDRARASGNAVSHTFADPGSLRVTVTATDTVGNSSTRSVTVKVRDTVSPRIQRLTIASRRFRVGSKPTAKSAARRGVKRGLPRGTTIRSTLSERATATFHIDRVLTGRRVGRSCKQPTLANRGHHACKRYARAGTLTRRARKGANALAFSGRIGRRALAPGGYRLTLTARDGARHRSRPRSLTFAIVRG